MWFVFLIFLGLGKGSLGMSDYCLVQADFNCSAFSILEASFPGDKGEVEAACSKLREQKECVENYARICQQEKDDKDGNKNKFVYQSDVDNIRNIMQLINHTSEICQEDSKLQERFLETIECYKNIYEADVREENCLFYSSIALEHVDKRMCRKLDHEYRMLEARGIYETCLESIFRLNCYVVKIDKECGSLAKDNAIEIIRGSRYLDVQCPVNYRLDVLELTNDYKLITSQDIYAKEFLLTDLIS